LLEELIPGAVQVSGKDSDEEKEEKLVAFQRGEATKLVIKPVIGAWGLNLQMCSHMTAFVSHSHEQDYQCIRRCYRFGQQNTVRVDRILSDGERNVLANQVRKTEQADMMFENLVRYMRDALTIQRTRVFTKEQELPPWL
jgi:SNF2 family DNA or RNA helicase